MQKIITHLWFDKEAKDATALYTSLFPDSRVTNISTIKDTPSGDCDMVSFQLAGQEYMAISAGPVFRFNPSVSLFAVFHAEKDIKTAWDALVDGGKILMPYDKYPWADRYGWLQDRYGLSWQLSMSTYHDMKQTITPFLMFTKGNAGKAEEAIRTYTDIFPDSKIDSIVPYAKNDTDTEGYVKHSRFTLLGSDFMAMDSSAQHDFVFNEAISFIVRCDTQTEIDRYWGALSAVPEAEQCGWLKDKYGVSWQIVPTIMNVMMAHADKEQTARVTQAFLKMKKFDIESLKRAYEHS